MKKIYMFLILLISLSSFAQDINQINMLSDLDGKKYATFGDAVKLFVNQLDKKSAGFSRDVNLLTNEGILKNRYPEDKPLTKGNIAIMTARYLKLNDSLMYVIFGTERYAFRACAAAGFMDDDGSENDLISGPQLIEIFSMISRYRGE